MKTILIGFDAFDPKVFERLHGQGKLPNLGKMVSSGGYQRFNVSNPAQSEVSWTSIATGLNPGGHGLFDFVHRNPKNYSLHVSLLPTTQGVLGTQFAQPHQSQTIFDHAVENGYPASALWWPAMFPARQTSLVNMIPGLGTPDILGRLGTNYYFTVDTESFAQNELKTQIEPLTKSAGGDYVGLLKGPLRKQDGELAPTEIEFKLQMLDETTSQLQIQKQSIDLQLDQWSPIFEVSFKLGMMVSVKAVTRVMLKKMDGKFGLYMLPLQIHPMHSPWPYASPANFMKKTWKTNGPFLTLGWPQDTTGLEEDFITDDQFLQLCDSIVESREQVFMRQLAGFEEGVLGIVFDTLDRVQHMFWRDRQDVIDSWYIKLDGLFGRVVDEAIPLGDDTRIMMVSDHGFASFDHKVNLNRVLQEQGYLKTQQGQTAGGLEDVDWSETQAYALGLNSIYLNLAGREGQGVVPVDQIGNTIDKIKTSLKNVNGPDGKTVFENVYAGSEVFEGKLVAEAPDVMLGYAPGFRASAETGLGKWVSEAIEPNKDHWGADHCIDPAMVQGVLFSNHGLKDLPNPSYKDIPQLVVGTDLEDKQTGKRPELSDEDQAEVEERLKGLGYL